MKITFTKQDLENPATRDVIVKSIGDSKHGGFCRLHGHEPKTGHGTIQDATYCKGISYANAIKSSLDKLAEIEASDTFDITVTRGTYQNAQGIESPSGRKNKAHPHFVTVTETYDRHCNTMREALAKIRNSLENPRPSKEYKTLGNGVHMDPENGKLYLRDMRHVSKNIIKHGDYPNKATSAVVAVADAIKRDMPIGNYRQINLDGKFEKVTFGGIELAPESQPKPADEVLSKVETINATEAETETVDA